MCSSDLLVGIGMRSHVGIAAKMFKALANEGINIQMISTSEIKTSVVIDEKYLELAVRQLHRTFELDQSPQAAWTRNTRIAEAFVWTDRHEDG